MNGGPNSWIRPAAAEIATHSRVDLCVGRRWFLPEQRTGGHNLTRLAVAALRNVNFDPRLLDGVRAIGRETFNRRDRRFSGIGNCRDAGARGLPIDVDRACAAYPHAAPKL